jgi:DNA polymerase I-like protein with 3'-5' exonuclease and polymerase domains
MLSSLQTETLEHAAVLAGHNVPVDLDQLLKLGLAKDTWIRGENVRDSLLLARMADENRGKGAYKLQPLLMAHANAEPWKDETEELGFDAEKWPAELRAKRCAIDAWASAVLSEKIRPEVPAAVQTFTHRVSMTLHRMYLAGAIVDKKAFKEISDDLHARVTRHRDLLVKAAFRAGMKEFSPTKDDDLRELLYERMKLPVLRKTRKDRKPAVDNYTLAQHKENKVVATLLDFNKADKLYSTWHGYEGRTGKRPPLSAIVRDYHGLPDERHGYLAFSVNPLGARTGRRSSGRSDEIDDVIESPNSQNWPKPLRRIIVSRFPKGLIGNFDYSKLEVLLFAWLSGDTKLFEYFTKRGGYIGIGKDFFKTTIEKDTPQYTLIKSTHLAIQYNAGDHQLATQLWFKMGIKLAKTWEKHLVRCHEIRLQYLDMFPGIRRFIQERKHELLTTKQVRILTGRVRHLPHSFSSPPLRGDEQYGVWKHLLNEAVNAPVQGLASEVTGSAEVDVEEALCDAHRVSLSNYHAGLLAESERVLRGETFVPFPMSRLINEVHDSLVADLHPASVKRDTEIIVETMRAVPTLRKICPAFTLKLDLEPKVDVVWGG